jgi:hypothetical protein
VPLTYGGVFGRAGTVVESKPLDVPAGGGGIGGGHVEHAGFLWQQLQPTANSAALRTKPTNALRSIIWLSPLDFAGPLRVNPADVPENWAVARRALASGASTFTTDLLESTFYHSILFLFSKP